MGVIIFIFFFTVLLTLLTATFIRRKEAFAKDLLALSTITTLSNLLFLVLLIAVYNGVLHTNKIISKFFYASGAGVSFFVLSLTMKMPHFEKKKINKFTVFSIIVHVLGVISSFLFVYDFTWDKLYGFRFDSYMVGKMPFIRLYSLIFLALSPFMAIIISIVKFVTEKSRIHKQQIFLYTSLLFMTLTINILVSYLLNIFSWVFVMTPVGYILFIFLVTSVANSTIVYDRRQIGFALIRFLVFGLLFAVISACLSIIALTEIKNLQTQITVLVFITFMVLMIRSIVSEKLRWLLGDKREYAEEIEKKLQKIDYSEGREKVIKAFSEIVSANIKTEGVDILVSDEKNILYPILSSSKNKQTFLTNTAVFDFVIEQNISVAVKSQVLTDAVFQDIRSELVSIMNRTSSEVMIFVREGQKIIGLLGFQQKRKGEAFTAYDIEVLTNLYSYFFLIIYYLKNIAKQDIVLTVDREIEMSDQIIESIQKNMDIIQDKIIDIDSVSYSAHRLGGDFIDFIKLSENRYFFLIGDMAGKGLSASMSMLILKSVLHTYIVETPDFKELISKLNSFIKDNLPKGTFFAGLFGIIDFKTATIYYLNCGIPLMAMYVNSYKNVIEIQGEGRVLGFVKNIKPFLKVRKITMNKDDIIVLTTDGLLESENLKGDRFGNERVGRLITANRNDKAGRIAKAIYDSLGSFISTQIEDDVTILVLKHK